MMRKLLYFGPQWAGSTSLQRLHAFKRIAGIEAIGVDNCVQVSAKATLLRRLRWKLRIPADAHDENERLIDSVATHRPDIVIVDNSKVVRRTTLRQLRVFGAIRLVYYSPDDIVAPHNLSLPLKWSLPDWDVVCTTKTFNVPELARLGVKQPFLVGKAFDSGLHRPLAPDVVGTDYERFDAVFVGTYEPERCASINALSESGRSIVVYGADKGNWKRHRLRAGIELRDSAFAEDYVAAWHTGKVALCFLRKINRDRITQRTMEIAAIGRPMVAERTIEHDQHFEHGREYLGFRDDNELIAQVRDLVLDDAQRVELGLLGRQRCLESGYSSLDRARQMIDVFCR